MINDIINIILSFVTYIVDLILLPFDLLFSNLPVLSEINVILGYINDFIDLIVSYVPFVVDLSLLPTFVIHHIVLYHIARVTISFGTYVVKTAIKWYIALKA